MRVRATDEYRQLLTGIVTRLRGQNPTAAKRIAASIRSASKRLEAHPLSGREQSNGSRKLVEARYGYIIYYGVDVGRKLITLYSIQHGAQQRPLEDA